jgi:hypothetical protein
LSLEPKAADATLRPARLRQAEGRGYGSTWKSDPSGKPSPMPEAVAPDSRQGLVLLTRLVLSTEGWVSRASPETNPGAGSLSPAGPRGNPGVFHAEAKRSFLVWKKRLSPFHPLLYRGIARWKGASLVVLPFHLDDRCWMSFPFGSQSLPEGRFRDPCGLLDPRGSVNAVVNRAGFHFGPRRTLCG